MDALTLARATGPTPAIAALLDAHFQLMRSTSPAESCHVMEPSAVFEEADVVVTAAQGAAQLGIGALKQIGPDHGELKSMHTFAAARGQGIGAAILDDLMARAREMGLTRLSLETGSMPEFAAARKLYANHGFEECPPFGNYVLDPLSTFMTRTL